MDAKRWVNRLNVVGLILVIGSWMVNNQLLNFIGITVVFISAIGIYWFDKRIGNLVSLAIWVLLILMQAGFN